MHPLFIRYPKLEFESNLQKMDVPLQVLVQIGGATVINLKLSLRTKGQVNIAGNVLSGTCDEIETKTVVVSSKIGDIDATLVNDVMDELFTKTIIPDVNAFFKKGFMLPCIEKVRMFVCFATVTPPAVDREDPKPSSVLHLPSFLPLCCPSITTSINITPLSPTR